MAFHDVLDGLVPISQFNQGQASRLFSYVKPGKQLIVLKNNAPVAIVISPIEYSLISKIREKLELAAENNGISDDSLEIIELVKKLQEIEVD